MQELVRFCIQHNYLIAPRVEWCFRLSSWPVPSACCDFLLCLQTALDLLCLADRYGFESLHDSIETNLCASLTLPTALQFVFYGETANVPRLQQVGMQFLDTHAARVLASPAILDLAEEQFRLLISRDTFLVEEICVFEAVQRWMHHNGRSKAEVGGAWLRWAGQG